MSFWYWLPESQFTLENISNLDIRTLLPTSLMRQLSAVSPTHMNNKQDTESESDSDFIDTPSDKINPYVEEKSKN